MNEKTHSMPAAGFQYLANGQDVRRLVGFGGTPYPGLGGYVKDGVHSLANFWRDIFMGQVDGMKLHFLVAGAGGSPKHMDFMPLVQETPDNSGPNESSSTGNEYLHGSFSLAVYSLAKASR